MTSMRLSFVLQAVVLVLCAIAPLCVQAESLRLPMTIPLPLLRILIVQNGYPLVGERAKIFDGAQGCNQIELSAPQVGEERGLLRFQTKVAIHWGAPVMESCLTPFAWEGSITLWQRPQIDANWRLTFETIDSAVFDKNNKPVQAVDLLWSLLKDHVHAYLNKIAVNLAPPVADLKNTLLPMFDQQHQTTAQHFLASMRPGRPSVQPDGLNADILADLALARLDQTDQPAPQLTPQDYARTMSLWRAWDDYLVLLLRQFAGASLSEEERTILLTTMLTARYAFDAAIAQGQLSNAFVRNQFLEGWSQLAPVFRNHLLGDTQANILGYLAFFSANDALRILDQLGPEVGIEISEEGFRRLAGLINSGPFVLGSFSSDADQQLRQVMGLPDLPEPPLPTDKPAPLPEAEENDPTSLLQRSLWRDLAILLGGPASAWAAEQNDALAAVRQWTAELIPAAELLPRVRDVLLEAATSHRDQFTPLVHADDWFVHMILAAAWQESCFRQFRVQNNTITYTLSSNQSSVGVMQINERIWRGVYNIKQLRWNIAYNSQAGCEIMALYLRDYLLKEKAPADFTSPAGQRFLAGWLYALYNGGPGQTKPFLQRYKNDKLLRAEQLFLAKFDAVTGEEWAGMVYCLP